MRCLRVVPSQKPLPHQSHRRGMMQADWNNTASERAFLRQTLHAVKGAMFTHAGGLASMLH